LGPVSVSSSFQNGANIFLLQGGKLHTPTPDCFLDGLTRQAVIGLARARGIEVIERATLPEELARTQEVFITGTAAEVTPVGEIDGQSFTVGEITQELMTAYSELVRNHAEASASAA